MKKVMMRILALTCSTIGLSLTASVCLAGQKCVVGVGNHISIGGCEDISKCGANRTYNETCYYARWAKGDYCISLKNGGRCVDKIRQTQIYRSYSVCVIVATGSVTGADCICSDSQRGPEMTNPADTADQGYCE